MDTPDSIRRAQPLLGTYVEIAAAAAARSDLESIIESAFAAVAQVHRLMSFHNADSDVNLLNREASRRTVKVHPWTFQVLTMAAELHRHSKGLFDITVAPVLQKIGLLPRVADAPPLHWVGAQGANLIELLPGHRVHFRRSGVTIDLGGIAKGFAVDRAIEVLQGRGISNGIVNAGGDLAAFGSTSHKVYIRDPRDLRRLLCQVDLSNEALASTSARFDPFRSADVLSFAVIDPHTRMPVAAINGATVRARTCMIADALTKIVMIGGASAAAMLNQYRASGLMVCEGGDVRVTSDWQSAVHLAA